MDTIKNIGWQMIQAFLGINLALGILHSLGIFKDEKKSFRDRLRERIMFSRIQPVDVDLGARHL